MSVSFDRFLNARHGRHRKASLGRAYCVVRQTWRLSDDPQRDPPREEVVAARRSASEAADLAREAAWSYRRNGFHKPSGAWWGADGEEFHRFQVRSRMPQRLGAIAVVALASLATLAIVNRNEAGRRKTARKPGKPAKAGKPSKPVKAAKPAKSAKRPSNGRRKTPAPTA